MPNLEQIVRDSLVEFEERGITDDDLLRVKMSIVSGKVYGLESVFGKVAQLAAYQYLTGAPDFAPADVAPLRERHQGRRDARLPPLHQGQAGGRHEHRAPTGRRRSGPAKDTWQRYERKLPDYESVADDDLAYRRAEDTFDRSAMPSAGRQSGHHLAGDLARRTGQTACRFWGRAT